MNIAKSIATTLYILCSN